MPSGKAAQVSHGEIGNVGDVGVGVGARLKINLDQAHAGHRAGFHVIDAAAKGEESLEGIGDVRFDLLRGHPVVKGGDEDDGNIDGRKHVDGHLREAGDSQDTNEKADDDDEVGMANREGWHVYSIPGSFDELRGDQLAFLELILLAEDDRVVFAQSGKNFHFSGGLQTELHFALLEAFLGIHEQGNALACSCGLDRLHRNGENVRRGMQRDAYAWHTFPVPVRKLGFGTVTSVCMVRVPGSI